MPDKRALLGVIGIAGLSLGAMWLIMRKPAGEVLSIVGMSVYNIPSEMQPATWWYLTWRGKAYGCWTSVGIPIIMENILSVGKMVIYIDTALGIQKFDLGTLTLEVGPYAYNVTTGEIERVTIPV